MPGRQKEREKGREVGAYSKSSLIAATKRGASSSGCICEIVAKKLGIGGLWGKGKGEAQVAVGHVNKANKSICGELQAQLKPERETDE